MTPTSIDRNRKRSVAAVPRADIHPAILGLVLVLVCAPLFFFRLNTFPTPWYDEGYTTQVSRLLYDEGVYGTYNGPEGYRLFDPTISSGPTVVLPVTLSFELFGLGMGQARLVVAIYSLIALYGCFVCMTYIFGSKSAFLSVIFLMIIPLSARLTTVSFLHTGRQVLGEMPALAFVIFALYLLFRSWDRKSWLLAIFAGLLLGLGVMTKPQIVFGLFPGMGLIVLGRSFKNWRSIFHNMTPLVVATLLFGAWMLIQRAGQIDAVRQESGALMLEVIRLHFFTGLFGTNLSKGALALAGVMVLVALLTFWRVIMLARKSPMTNMLWAEATIAAIVLCSAIWYSLFSVGFERYAFMGMTLSILLLGNFVYALLTRALHTVAPKMPSETVLLGLSVVLLAAVFGLNAFKLVRQANPEDVIQNMAAFIDRTVPDYALVESLELELTSVAPRRQYHRANYRNMYTVIQQYGHDQVPFDIGYDVLEQNPDFLIVGFMADWTHMYNTDVMDANFRELARFGSYRILQRVRSSSEE